MCTITRQFVLGMACFCLAGKTYSQVSDNLIPEVKAIIAAIDRGRLKEFLGPVIVDGVALKKYESKLTITNFTVTIAFTKYGNVVRATMPPSDSAKDNFDNLAQKLSTLQGYEVTDSDVHPGIIDDEDDESEHVLQYKKAGYNAFKLTLYKDKTVDLVFQ